MPFFAEMTSTFCRDFMWYSVYLLRTLHTLLINILCTEFVYILKTFCVFLLDVYEDFVNILCSPSFFFPSFFLQGFCRDFTMIFIWL